MLAWIETPQARLRLESERLIVTLPATDLAAEIVTEIPLAELDRVILTEEAHITTPALCALMHRGISVLFHTAHGLPLGACQNAEPRQGRTRLLQYERSLDANYTMVMVRRLLESKISNQRRLLQRLTSSRKAAAPADAQRTVDLLAALQQQLGAATGVEMQRGTEGAASACYWKAWAAFLPDAFPFECRSAHPPLNAVNAVISYLSTLVYGECLAACHRRGLDAALGYLHPAQDGRWSLPCDLMEPFRPALVEPLTLRLFNHRVLRTEHFEPQNGGIYLTLTGRRLLLEQYEKRLRARFLLDHSSQRTSLRDQIDATTLSWKLALTDASTFTPFLMN